MTTLEGTADTVRGLRVGWNSLADETNCGATSAIRDEREVANWNAVINQIVDICQLDTGWDGDGAPAPAKPLLATTMRIATGLRHLNCPAPSRAVATFDGTVILEWQDSGYLMELEVVSPSRAELTIHRQGRPTLHKLLSW
jgi:hypothetical protein